MSGDRTLPPSLAAETERLERSWMRHPVEMLRDYMVAGVHDPRLNPQSLQARHFLIEARWGDRFAALREEEFHFAIVLHWLQQAREDWPAVAHALARGLDNAEGRPIPAVVTRAFRRLPVRVDGREIPNYVRTTLDGEPGTLDTFSRLWSEALTGLEPAMDRWSVLEPACGSASDYRAWAAHGLDRHFDYSGFDLCPRNIENARALFPGVNFAVGNVFAIDHPDRAFDYCLVHDLLEHLSPAGLERALAELNRVTRQGLCVGFFQMHEGPEHVVRPVEEYHWNTLSLPRLREQLEALGWSTQAVHVRTWLRWRVGCGEDAYYDSAYTLFARRAGSTR